MLYEHSKAVLSPIFRVVQTTTNQCVDFMTDERCNPKVFNVRQMNILLTDIHSLTGQE